MRIELPLSYSNGKFAQAVASLADYERVGLDAVSVAELYSFDAVSQLGYLAASTQLEIVSSVLQIYTRTPTLTAMTAAGLDYVSGGRFTLGLGTSGPQVIEGFHGVPYDAPLARTRELVEICRSVWRRERLEYAGDRYRIPLPPEEGTGLGKPLKLIERPVRDRIPIMIAALGPRNVALTAEIAESWAPLFYRPESAAQVWGAALASGAERRDATLPPLRTVASVHVDIGPDADERLDELRPMLALYVGGMGARGRNYYNDLVARFGFADAAALVQDHYLNGRKRDAEAALPRELLRAISLVGPEAHVRERIAAFAESGVTGFSAVPLHPEHAGRVATIAKLRELADD